MRPLPVADRWASGRIKHLADVTLGKMLQSSDSGNDVLANYMRAANVQPDGVLMLEPKQMWFSASELDSLSLRRGDAVVVEGGVGGYGRAAFLSEDLPGWGFQNSINRLRPLDDNDGRFLAYYLIALRASGYIERYCNVVSMPHLTAEKLAALPSPIPDAREQRAIADYLDRETARIDTLIEEQQRLIEMLRERRRAVISSSVARGVDSRATGFAKIEWLGAIPEHWRLGQIKHLGKVTLGKMLQPSNSGNDVHAPYMRAANVQPDGVLREDDVKEMWFSTDELASLDLRRGDVVVVEGGIGGYGRAAYLDHDLIGWGFQNSINRIRPYRETDGRYLAYFLIAARAKGFIEVYCNVVSMPHLTAEKLNSIPVPIPPLDEQRRIAAYLDEQTAKIDTLIAETETFIELARERRSALITAAVTGQIDVRDVA